MAARTEELKGKRREKLRGKSSPNAFEIASKSFEVASNHQNQTLASTEVALLEAMSVAGAFIEKGAQMGRNFMLIGAREANPNLRRHSFGDGLHVVYDNGSNILRLKGGEGTFYKGSEQTTMSHDGIEIEDDSFNSIRIIITNETQRLQLCYRVTQAGFCVDQHRSFGGDDANYLALSLWGDAGRYNNSENLFIAHCKASGGVRRLFDFNLQDVKRLNLQNRPSYFPTGPCPSPPIHLQTSGGDCSTDADEAESDAKTGKTTNDATDENLPIAEVVNVEGDELCAIGPRMTENLIIEDTKDDNNNDDVL